MPSLLTLIFAAAIVALFYYLFGSEKTVKGAKRLPGPKGLPILGNVLSATWTPHVKFGEWAKQYGKLFKVNLAGYKMVVISDAKLAKEAYNNNVLLGKPDFPLFNILAGGNYGIFASYGHVWQEQRRFTLKNLRDFGFGKTAMQQLAMQEVRDYIDWLKSQEGQSISLNRKFTLATINSLWMIISGKRFKQDDPKVTAFMDNSNKVFTELLMSPLVLFWPTVAKMFPKLSGWSQLMEVADENHAFVKGHMDEHKAEFTPGKDPEDFMDAYLKQISETTDPKSTFYKQNGDRSLHVILGDLFGAGSETTSATLSWAIMLLTKFPETQRKVHEELDRVVGKERQPTLEDRANTPYIEAVIMETLRKSSLTALGIFHSALEDTTLSGYGIPKDTWISVNQYHIHHDPEVWGDPHTFRPERFLSEDGKTVVKSENLIPFSTGKRMCVGEQIAKDSIYLFLTAIMQRFETTFDSTKPVPGMESPTGFFLTCDKYFVVMKDRLE